MKITFDLYNEKNGSTQRKSFDGEWIISPDDECGIGVSLPGWPAENIAVVARTDQGRVFFGVASRSYAQFVRFEVFETFDEFFDDDKIPDAILSQVRSKINPDYVEHLDI